MAHETERGEEAFVVCPHCWQLNPPSRFCAKCLADMTLLLQESGGRRWTAAAQSPIPVRVAGRLAAWQRWVLLGAVVLFGLGQVALALAPPTSRAPVERSR